MDHLLSMMVMMTMMEVMKVMEAAMGASQLKNDNDIDGVASVAAKTHFQDDSQILCWLPALPPPPHFPALASHEFLFLIPRHPT